ncbi:MAG: hypothetical protein Q8934_04820 [Bacillota bacterium]|nr:hypothetical protein [Bacillota bacterium]
MKICEICGTKEENEKENQESFESVTLHVCESCREDRKWNHYENWAF